MDVLDRIDHDGGHVDVAALFCLVRRLYVFLNICKTLSPLTTLYQ